MSHAVSDPASGLGTSVGRLRNISCSSSVVTGLPETASRLLACSAFCTRKAPLIDSTAMLPPRACTHAAWRHFRFVTFTDLSTALAHCLSRETTTPDLRCSLPVFAPAPRHVHAIQQSGRPARFHRQPFD